MNDFTYIKIYFDYEKEQIELLYDIDLDKIWIDKPNLSLLTKTSYITLSRQISKLITDNILDIKENIKPYKKSNYKTTYLYDNSVIQRLIKDDSLYKELIKFEIDNINMYKKRILGKIYLKDGLLFLNDLLVNERNVSFNKDDVIKFLDLDKSFNLEDKNYSLEDIFDYAFKVNNNKGIDFKNWAYQILYKCLVDGYYINNEKCYNDKKKIISITNIADNLLATKSLSNEEKYMYYKSVINYDDTLYDSTIFINNLFKHAKEKIIIISKYLNDKVFDLISSLNTKIIIYTSKYSLVTQLSLKKYSKKHDLVYMNNYKHEKTYIIIDTTIYNFDISITNIFKENSICKLINIKYSDFINSII